MRTIPSSCPLMKILKPISSGTRQRVVKSQELQQHRHDAMMSLEEFFFLSTMAAATPV
jgi:hypothetical protein